MPAGQWWYSHRQMQKTMIHMKPWGDDRCNTVVVDLVKKAGYKVAQNENTRQEFPNQEKLAGHFLRGHSGSLAYFLAVEHGASWNPMLGIDRARHTINSFFSSYARGVALRISAAFNKHPHKDKLRFETAARL